MVSPTQNFSVSPSHGLWLFTNSSSMGTSHEMQSFKKKLQNRSSMGSQVLPTNLLYHGLLFSHVHRSLPGPCSTNGSMGSQPLLGIHLLLHGLQEDILSSVEFHGLQVPCFTMVLTTGCRGISASGSWSTSSLSFCTDLDVYWAVSLTYSHSSPWPQLHLHNNFFLKYVTTEALLP